MEAVELSPDVMAQLGKALRLMPAAAIDRRSLRP
jgi:hypothetical protein